MPRQDRLCDKVSDSRIITLDVMRSQVVGIEGPSIRRGKDPEMGTTDAIPNRDWTLKEIMNMGLFCPFHPMSVPNVCPVDRTRLLDLWW